MSQREAGRVESEAARMLLSSMMVDRSLVPVVVEGLKPVDFYDQRHGAVYAAILTCFDAGEPTTYVAVSAQLAVTGDLGRVGGTKALHDMVEGALLPALIPSEVRYYVGIVAEAARVRRLTAAAARVQVACEGGNEGQLRAALDDLDKARGEQRGSAETLRFREGGGFVLDVPDVAPAVWGDGAGVIWAQGEALMICGPSGVGKTTLALQVLRARLGLQDKVLGYSVAQTGGRILYLVMDRPAQFRRAAKRVFTEDDRALLDQRLVVWKGPPPKDIAANPEILSAMCAKADADTVVVDSLKDAAVGIAKDEVGAGYNRARQHAIADGFEVAETHHMRKSSADNKEPNGIDDIYGSTWLTAGAGSVVLLWGEPGDPVVKFRHLKQPESEVGPFNVLHDHDTGVSEVQAGVDLAAMIVRSGTQGVTTLEYAVAMFGVVKPNPAQKEKARRRLEREVDNGLLSRVGGTSGGGGARYFLRVS